MFTVLLYTLGITTYRPLGAKMKGFVLFPPLTVGVEFAVSVPSEPIRYWFVTIRLLTMRLTNRNWLEESTVKKPSP